MKNIKHISACCKADMVVISSDEGTSYYSCSKCNKPANTYVEDTKIKPDLMMKSSSPSKMKPDWEEEIKIALIKIESLHAEVQVGDFDATVTSFDKSRQVIRNLLAKQEEQHKAELKKNIDWCANTVNIWSDEIKQLKQQHKMEMTKLNSEWQSLSKQNIDKLKQQHRADLEGLKMKHDKPNHTDDCNDIYWCDTCDMTLDDNGECGCELVNKTIDRFNEAITNLLEQKGK